MEKNKKRMWEFPWRYRESIAFVSGIMITGFILQLTLGTFDYYLLQSPVNIILGGILIILIAILSRRNNEFTRWFSGIPFSVCLICTLLFFTLIMGLTPQVNHIHDHEHDLFSLLGFRQMTSSWAFIFIYLTTLLSLGMLIARRLKSFRKQDYGFYLNHIGLWLILFSAGLGSADIKRYVMHVREGEVEWRVYNERGDVLDLPVAIRLNDFDMEEYPPKLTLIDRESGIPQPEEKPDFYQIDVKRPDGKLWKWNIHLEEYIHLAIRNSDSTYHEVYMPGSSPAAFIKAIHQETGEIKEGWVCAGNMAQLYMTLPLDSAYCIVMTQPEPKRFISDIDVFTEDGKQAHTILEVNKPMRVGHWTIYQYGYDNQAGRMSAYSSMELVYDPWVWAVYIGIFLLGLGSITLLWTGKNKNNRRNDVE